MIFDYEWVLIFYMCDGFFEERFYWFFGYLWLMVIESRDQLDEGAVVWF